jgi:integrase
MDFCCTFYDLPENVVKKVPNFKKDFIQKKIDFYSYDEFKRFIFFVDDIVYKRFFEIMFYCGTRPGETLALKFSDLSYRCLSISKTLTSKGGVSLDTPKNISSVRDIPIDKTLYNDLIKLKKYYTKLFGSCNDDYFICGGLNHLSPTTCTRRKNLACKRANLRCITLHQFRHSHATLLCSSGVPINVVSKRLGHSNLSTTTDVYIHCSLEHEKRVVTTLNSLRNNFFDTLTSNFKNFISYIKTYFL